MWGAGGATAAADSGADGDDFVAEAKAKVEAATQPASTWDGPTSGPAAQADKLIVYVASDLRNGGVLGVSKGVEEAAKAIGWEAQVLDGQGTVSGRTAALNQAITLQPNGIILGGFDAVEQQAGIEQAAGQGIPIVGWHAAANPGPIEGTPVFANVATDANDVAQIAALYAVAQSDGKAGVIVFTDSAFSVAIAKSDAMAAVIKQCAGCTLLSVEDTPLADTSTRMPQLVTSLLQRYGEEWTYSLGINDLYFDFGGPALATAGKSPEGPPYNLSAGDGSEAAYQRIRENQFQAGTVPEPLNLHGWQLVDELNRAFAGEQWSGYITPVHLVTPDNIEFDGGPNNVYDPDNGYRDEYKKIWGK
ncbi:MAG: sugar ABC transporter substrate-binding protein [Anaerolineae bacterium]|nr:substrate-binding domain-containing protein [Anaerolineales bacterium]MCQ3979567.1 sugar ABC transporter substrate-binding protein [Anaerolineae bacterium]